MRGSIHLNFLYLSIFYKGYGIPLFFKVLPDKKGHSGVSDRKELIDKFIQVFGKEQIAYINCFCPQKWNHSSFYKAD